MINLFMCVCISDRDITHSAFKRQWRLRNTPTKNGANLSLQYDNTHYELMNKVNFWSECHFRAQSDADYISIIFQCLMWSNHHKDLTSWIDFFQSWPVLALSKAYKLTIPVRNDVSRAPFLYFNCVMFNALLKTFP